MRWHLWLGVAGGVLLLLGNAFFVVTEFAMTRVRQFAEEEFDDDSGLQRAWDMTGELEIYLSGCQVGITMCSVGLGVAAEPALAALLEPVVRGLGLGAATVHTAAIVVALVAINLLHIIIGEQAPTYLGIERTRSVARHFAPLLYGWTKVMGPIIHLADYAAKAVLQVFGISMTRSWTEVEVEDDEETNPVGPRTERLTNLSDVRSKMGEVLSEGNLPRERRMEVMRALEIDQMTVREIMVPRERAVGLTTTSTLEDNLTWMREHPFDRYPLIGETWDDPKGIVYLTEVFQHLADLEAGHTTLERVAHAPPMTVPSETAVSDLIDRFQEASHEQALVMDAEGKMVGLVTTTDAFEAIAGDLEDPVDQEQAHRRRDETVADGEA